MATVMLKRLRSVSDEHAGKFDSNAFRTLFAMLKRELEDEYFDVIEAHLKEVRFRQTLWIARSDESILARQRSATVEALAGIGPKDEIEGNDRGPTSRRAQHRDGMLSPGHAGEPDLRRKENLNQANKLSRTYATLLEALNRYRGKGQQKVTVEHVHVHSGGQAVVGMVAATPRLPGSEESNAKQVAHAPQPALRSEDPKREAMPIPSDAERPVQDARRGVSRGSEGQ
jgi:hypothetical protein